MIYNENYNTSSSQFISSQNETIITQEGPFSENYEKIKNTFIKAFDVGPALASRFTKEILSVQQTLNENESIKLPLSENFPFDVVIKKERTYCFIKKIGEGTYSHVYITVIVASHRHEYNSETLSPSKPARFVLKESKNTNVSYSPEKKLLDQAVSPKKQGVDYFVETFKDVNGHGYSVNEEYTMSVDSIPYEKLHSPDQIALIYYYIAGALVSMHKRGFIHRDIKGANLLISMSTENKISAITDPGFLMKELSTNHRTIGTPDYLDPGMFGNAGTTLINQRKRIGRQTKEGDIFALGLTLIKDTLIPIISKLSENSTNKMAIANLLNELKPKYIKGVYHDKNLEELGNQRPLRAMHLGKTTDNSDKLIFYRSVNTYRVNLCKCFKLLDDLFHQEEIEAFIDLAELSCDMQEADLSLRLTAAEVQNQISIIFKQVEKFYQTQQNSKNTDYSEESEYSENFENSENGENIPPSQLIENQQIESSLFENLKRRRDTAEEVNKSNKHFKTDLKSESQRKLSFSGINQEVDLFNSIC